MTRRSQRRRRRRKTMMSKIGRTRRSAIAPREWCVGRGLHFLFKRFTLMSAWVPTGESQEGGLSAPNRPPGPQTATSEPCRGAFAQQRRPRSLIFSTCVCLTTPAIQARRDNPYRKNLVKASSLRSKYVDSDDDGEEEEEEEDGEGNSGEEEEIGRAHV